MGFGMHILAVLLIVSTRTRIVYSLCFVHFWSRDTERLTGRSFGWLLTCISLLHILDGHLLVSHCFISASIYAFPKSNHVLSDQQCRNQIRA